MDRAPRAMVFTPSPLLTVMIKARPDAVPGLHLHAGGLAAGLIRREGMEQALKLGAAAGALNATRHGLGTGHRDLIERLARRIEIHPVEL